MTPASIPETPDFLLPESALSAELRERAKKAAALAARTAHLAFLHPPHTTFRGKDDGKAVPTIGNATLTEADPACRVTMHPIGLAESSKLPVSGYVSLQRHGEACRSDELASINVHGYTDCEIHEGTPFFGMEPEDVAGIILARHDAAGVPRPSYALFSGRGLWFVHATQGFVPPQAKGRVLRAIRAYWGEEIKTGRGAGTEAVVAKAKAMQGLWEGVEIDWSVGDMSRVHRIAGSTNDKSGETVRLVWPSSWAEVKRSSFEEFADAVLPFSREETKAYLTERAAAREARAAAEGKVSGFCMGPRPARWAVIADEIMSLIRHHAGDGAVSPNLGLRDLLAHHVCTAWGLAGRGGDAREWAAELAPYLCGHKMTEAQLRNSLRSVERRLRQHEAGETVTYVPAGGGEPREMSPLYEYSVTRIVQRLKITKELASRLRFRILTPAVEDRKALTPAERQAARRERLGAQKRQAMADEKKKRSALILELTAEGLEADQVAELLGCCTRTVERALEEMFEGAADRAQVVLDIPDEDVSDDEMQALVEACTLTSPTDASRYLSAGCALVREPAPAATPEPIPAWIEADPDPELARLYPLFAADYPLPAGQSASEHADRLQALYWHHLATPTVEGRYSPSTNRHQALMFGLFSLQGEIQSGRQMRGLLPAPKAKAKPAPRPRRADRCGRPAPRLH